MAQPHSVEGKTSTVPKQVSNDVDQYKVMEAARYTLLSLRNQSLGRIATRYVHKVDMQTSAVAYARMKECVYGPRFARMHRFSQAFVMAHETAHHMLGHIPQGAVLYKQSPRTFSFKAYNIACDAIINWICENLPNEKNASSATGIVYAVRRCQEMGIVNWTDLVASMRKIAEKSGVELDPIFEKEITEVNSIQIYHAMMRVIRKRAAEKKSKRVEREAEAVWKGLFDHLAKLVEYAILEPSVLFTTTPLELGAVDLHDAIAQLVRTYTNDEAKPADHESRADVAVETWESLMATIAELVEKARTSPLHAFTRAPDRRAHALWNDLVAIVKAFDPNEEKNGDDQSEDDDDLSEDEETIIDRLADEMNADEDLREAIEEAAKRNVTDLNNDIARADSEFRRHQAGTGSGDVLKKVCPPGGKTATSWRNAVRRMMSSALVAKMSFDHRRPSRRTVSAMYQAMRPGADRSRNAVIAQTPMIKRHTDAKNTWLVIDTSGSIFSDRETLGQFIQEAETYGKTVHSRIKIVFADAEVCEVVDIGEAMHIIRTLVPKGGGGTDFGPAIALAESHRPDLIIYMTDLMGAFPPKKPRCPIIWAYPEEFDNHPTPYGMRLKLA